MRLMKPHVSGPPVLRWEDNIKMDLKETVCGLTQDMNQWRTY